MTKEKNVEFITCRKLAGTWKFTIRTSATRVADTVDEFGSVSGALLDALTPLCRITNCGFNVKVFDENEDFFEALRLNVEERNGFRETVQCDDGIQAAKLRDRFQNISIQHGHVLLTYFTTEEINVRLRLGSKDRYIRKSDTEFYKRQVHDDIIDKEPNYLPLEVNVRYHLGYDEHSNRVPRLGILFRSRSDIWFAETEQGAVNRQRLASVLQTVYEEFDVVWASFSSEITTKDTLTEQGMTELVFE